MLCMMMMMNDDDHDDDDVFFSSRQSWQVVQLRKLTLPNIQKYMPHNKTKSNLNLFQRLKPKAPVLAQQRYKISHSLFLVVLLRPLWYSVHVINQLCNGSIDKVCKSMDVVFKPPVLTVTIHTYTTKEKQEIVAVLGIPTGNRNNSNRRIMRAQLQFKFTTFQSQTQGKKLCNL